MGDIGKVPDRPKISFPIEHYQPILICVMCSAEYAGSMRPPCTRCNCPELVSSCKCWDCGRNIRPGNWGAHTRVCDVSRETEADRRQKAWNDLPWDVHVREYLKTGEHKHLDQALERPLPDPRYQVEVIYPEKKAEAEAEAAPAVRRKGNVKAIAPLLLLAASLVASVSGLNPALGLGLIIVYFMLKVVL